MVTAERSDQADKRPVAAGSTLGALNRRLPADSTLRDVSGARPRARLARRIGIALLFVVVVCGAAGLFGVRSATLSVSEHGYRMTVTYPRVARAGLDVPFRVHVHHPGGFPASLTVAISSHYFEMFETQGFFPQPDSETNNGRFVTLTFSKPPGEEFQLEYDTYIQPAAQIGKSAVVRVQANGKVLARTSIHTWLLP
jgi:hypothetical protein